MKSCSCWCALATCSPRCSSAASSPPWRWYEIRAKPSSTACRRWPGSPCWSRAWRSCRRWAPTWRSCQAARMALRSGKYPPSSCEQCSGRDQRRCRRRACRRALRSDLDERRSRRARRRHRRHVLPAPGALEGAAPDRGRGRDRLLRRWRNAGWTSALITLALAAPCAISTDRTSSALHQARA